MKIQQFLDHHGISANPFAEEDAQTDPVFKDHCIASTYHPAWDKVYGDPGEPATAVVFGEKGSGKTAMLLQIAQHLADYNRKHPERRVYVIKYDDFNPFLDRFKEHLGRHGRKTEKLLAQWKLWDHMDAILTLGVTSLVDQVLGKPVNGIAGCSVDAGAVSKLDRHQARDLLLLAASYDQSTAETFRGRWNRLCTKLRFWTITSYWPLAVGITTTVAVAALMITLAVYQNWEWLQRVWIYLVLLLIGWGPWLWRAFGRFRLAWGIVRHLRVGNRETNPLRQVLMRFTPAELSGQPLPNKDRTDDRYESLVKLQGLLRTLGFAGIVVLVDRVDEPYLINGSSELMRALLWPMLDNKFLKQPGIGVKLMLPIELNHFIEREDRDFYQRARLDKQNMIPSLVWTGQTLYDVASARIAACAINGATPSLRAMFEEGLGDRRLIEALESLRVPRHLFKFLYRVLVTHCNAHTDEQPVWRISPETFESVLALYRRDQDAFDRGVGAG